MTTADEELAAWLSNGEMAKHNEEPSNPIVQEAARELATRNGQRVNDPRGPGKTALPIVQNGQEVKRLGNPNQFRYEHDLQVAVFAWADTAVSSIPELAMLFAIPNGGHRHKSVAAKMKAEGVRAGVPDCFLAVPRGVYAGLFLELKVGRNKPTEAQSAWLTSLESYAYKTAVCCDLDSVKAVIVEYLNL